MEGTEHLGEDTLPFILESAPGTVKLQPQMLRERTSYVRHWLLVGASQAEMHSAKETQITNKRA